MKRVNYVLFLTVFLTSFVLAQGSSFDTNFVVNEDVGEVQNYVPTGSCFLIDYGLYLIAALILIAAAYFFLKNRTKKRISKRKKSLKSRKKVKKTAKRR